MNEIPIELLRRLIRLDAETGKLYWLKRTPDLFNGSEKQRAEHTCSTWNAKYAGKPALNSRDAKGYLVGRIFDRCFKAHRVVFALANGRWPSGQVDHERGPKANNDPRFLRDVAGADNQRNMRRPVTNTSGVQGVYWNKAVAKWQAYIQVNRKVIYLGVFTDIEDAATAREAAEIKYGFHPNHGRAAS